MNTYKLEEVYASTDPRDYMFNSFNFLNKTSNIKFPSSFSLLNIDNEIDNQYDIGSCVASATTSCLELMQDKMKFPESLSKLYVYYYLREPYPDLRNKDKGAYVRDGFKIVNKKGVCNENKWPYLKQNLNREPDNRAQQDAQYRKCNTYFKLPELSYTLTNQPTPDYIIDVIKHLVFLGVPVMFGMAIFDSFFRVKGNDLNSAVYIPDGKFRGRHAMHVIGYTENGFIIQNSWGDNWGYRGCFIMAFDDFIKNTFEGWICTRYKFFDNYFDLDTVIEQVIKKQKENKDNAEKDSNNNLFIIAIIFIVIILIAVLA